MLVDVERKPRNAGPIVIRMRNRAITLSVEGLSDLEISSIADQVEKKMDAIEKKTETVDASKLAILAAFEFAVELYTLKNKGNLAQTANLEKLDSLADKLENVIEKKLF